MPIIKRSTKGAPLTHAEMDGNWDELAKLVGPLTVVGTGTRVNASIAGGLSSIVTNTSSAANAVASAVLTNDASASINVNANSSGSTLARWGLPSLANVAEVYGSGGACNGIVVGVLGVKPVIIGVNNTEVGRFETIGAKFTYSGFAGLTLKRSVAVANASVAPLTFSANNSAGNEKDYAQIYAVTANVTAGSEQGHLDFVTRNGASATTRVRITSSGNCLIGTTTDDGANKLQVAGPIKFQPAASSIPPNNGDLTFEATSNTTLSVRFRGTDGVVRSATLTLT